MAAPTVPEYEFTATQDWFTNNIPNWLALLPRVTATHPRVLEVGSWEGRSAVFLLTELCKNGGEIVCIDHFDLMRTSAGQERYRKLKSNLAMTGKSFRIVDEFSAHGLMKVLEKEISAPAPGYDWIYIDGSHEADDTFLDGELAWRLARKGAIVIFDDYRWGEEDEESIHHPKRGIDAFMVLHSGEYIRLSDPLSYQIVLEKTSDMRIGFLVKDVPSTVDQDVNESMGYGINLALAVDSAYAMPAAVAIRSAIEATKGRMRIFILDCGLETEKQKLVSSIPLSSDKTLVFLDLPKNSLTQQMGGVWGKIDLLQVIPAERVLYIDSDVLVRADLRTLFDSSLEDKPIGAVVDVGHPEGHAEIDTASYFNAGVLLMDMSKVRTSLNALLTLAQDMRECRYRDQDVLNLHFANEWTSLSTRWNAQGLGTYANCFSPKRAKINVHLRDMKVDPSIVHFTGPVHPGLADVLNPYLERYTAKPWGYAGAPGHPYEARWWEYVEETAWKGVRQTEEWANECRRQKAMAVEEAIEAFNRRAGV